MTRLDLRDERGVTLLELMISVGLLGVVLAPITLGMMFGFANSNGTRDRLADSAAAQFVSAYFPTDVQAAGSKRNSDIGTGVAFTGNGTCPAPAAGSTVRLRLTIPDAATTSLGSGAPRTTVLYYSKSTGATTPPELYRLECRPSKTIGPSLLVNHLDDFSPACLPDTATCRTVTLTLKTFNPASKADRGFYDRTEYKLLGTRRTA